MSVLLPSSTLPHVMNRSRLLYWCERQVLVDVVRDQIGRVRHQKYPSCFFFSIEPALSKSMIRPCRSDVVASSISWMMSVSVVGLALDRPGQRVAAERAEPDRTCISGTSPSRSGMRSSSTMISVPSRSTTGRGRRVVERHDRDLLEVDVLPHVELGPVRDREHAQRLAVASGGRCRSATARAAGASDPTGAGPSGPRRSAPWPATSPRHAGRRRSTGRTCCSSMTCLRPSVFHMSVCTRRAVVERVDPALDALRVLVHDQLEHRAGPPCRRGTGTSSWNFHVVSTCTSGNGGFDG